MMHCVIHNVEEVLAAANTVLAKAEVASAFVNAYELA